MELIFENEYFKLGHQTELLTVFLKWKSFQSISFDNYKLPFETSHKFQLCQTVDNLLVDSRMSGVVPPNYRIWLQEFAIPLAANQGLKRAAVVTVTNVFKRYYFNKIMNTTDKFGVPFKIYGTTEEAVAWIKTFYKK